MNHFPSYQEYIQRDTQSQGYATLKFIWEHRNSLQAKIEQLEQKIEELEKGA
jgi:hypothetical protein